MRKSENNKVSRFIQIHPKDNILVAIADLEAGLAFDIGSMAGNLNEVIPAKHKFAAMDFQVGDLIFMYGVLVGKAIKPIAKGSRITVENVAHASGKYESKQVDFSWDKPDVNAWKSKTFNGYHRKDGKVGTANYWLVIPLVFCENRNVDVIESALSEALGYVTKKDFVVNTQALIDQYKKGVNREAILETSIMTTAEQIAKNRVFPNVDGIKFLKHDGGCGGIRQDSDVLCNLLASYITHPNVAGATVLSLGCQNAQIQILKDAIAQKDNNFSKPVFFLEQQKSSSERAYIEEAVKLTFTGLMEADQLKREPAPLSKLVVGLECGGSDGFSGITANPALGYASDLLVALGGSPILSEFPELNGVEQDLLDRCETNEIAQKFEQLMRAYSAAAVAVGSGFENNPSPGNIKDGLITDAMKSAGAAKKGGTSPVVDVLDYTETVQKPGLNLLCTPGNDVESTTGLAGSGANVIVFTTGLGTPTGNPISPVIKVSSNDSLHQRMNDLIDINAGSIISQGDSIAKKGEEILEFIINVASGEVVPKAVALSQDDFIPWKRGISL